MRSHGAPDDRKPRRQLRPGWPIAWLLLMLVRGYKRWISPLFPPACRFDPSCSAYAMQSLHTHPLHRAIGLTTWRLLRCQPMCKGGHDPVPPGKFTHEPTPDGVASRGPVPQLQA